MCVSLFVDMTGIIPEDEDEQDMYDDVGAIVDTPASEPIDEDLYEELPGLTTYFMTVMTSKTPQSQTNHKNFFDYFYSKVLFCIK